MTRIGGDNLMKMYSVYDVRDSVVMSNETGGELRLEHCSSRICASFVILGPVEVGYNESLCAWQVLEYH